MDRHLLARSLHDTGLAAWFGGSLMGAVGLNAAAAAVRDADQRTGVATAGWSRWAPVNAAAIGAHLIGAVQLLRTERHRIAAQEGVVRSSAVKTALTAAALGATGYSGVLNRKMAAAGNVPAQGATEPGARTPQDVASTQKQLKALQWVIPALTGGLLVTTSWQSEQQRPAQVAKGTLSGVLSALPGPTPAVPLAGLAAGLGLVAARRSRSRTTNQPNAPVYPVSATTSTTTYGVGTATTSGSPSGTGTSGGTGTGGTGTSGTGTSGTGTGGTGISGTGTGGTGISGTSSTGTSGTGIGSTGTSPA